MRDITLKTRHICRIYLCTKLCDITLCVFDSLRYLCKSLAYKFFQFHLSMGKS